MTKIIDPDAVLIQDIQHGSRDAFNQLVRRHQQTVCRLAKRLIEDEEEARDVAQEVFLLAWHELPKWRYKAKFFTWVYQTTWNLARGTRRKNRRLTYREQLPVQESATDNGADKLIAAENRAAVGAAVDALPERQRQVVLLRIYEKLSIADSAAVMKCKEGTIKALLFQALNRLADLIKTEGHYERHT